VNSSVDKQQVDFVRSGMESLPFSVDVCGIVDSTAWRFINRLAKGVSLYLGRPYSVAVSLLRRKITFALFLGTAKQLARFFNYIEEY
jgi:hypothetical protein